MQQRHNDLAYSVGGLLYMPAFQPNVAEKLLNNEYEKLTSLSFCLEDAIADTSVETSEVILHNTLFDIKNLKNEIKHLPLLFIRVRTPEHLIHIIDAYSDVLDILTGFILPKFDLTNADHYINIIKNYNIENNHELYLMPILESHTVADVSNRITNLLKIKEKLDGIHDYILNVRVGGNDFCNLYGIRRSVSQSIYQIGVIRDILVDIINVFSSDYIVSGPVWEYLGNDENIEWKIGLINEIEEDMINGFIGKTAIHPSQLPVIYENLKVSLSDYNDAKNILGWNDRKSGVSKSDDGSRMNEVKCHQKWAYKICSLAKIYGVKE